MRDKSLLTRIARRLEAENCICPVAEPAINPTPCTCTAGMAAKALDVMGYIEENGLSYVNYGGQFTVFRASRGTRDNSGEKFGYQGSEYAHGKSLMLAVKAYAARHAPPANKRIVGPNG